MVGLYRTSCRVQKSENFQNCGLFGNRTFFKKKSFFLFVYFVNEKKFQFDVILLFGMKMFQNICKGPVQQDLSRKFGYPVLSGQETQMPCLVEPYIVDARR